jgi:RNA polymerase sigma factor (TIGR02999 family)
MDDDITLLLHDWRKGDTAARDRLLQRVYGELRDMAGARWYLSGGGHTLQPTALLNEAVLRLCGGGIDWRDRAHFFALAALKMRAVMVDHARAQQAGKRGGSAPVVTLSHAEREAAQETPFDVLALDLALERLATRDPRAAKGLEMAYFGGMEVDEIACVLEVSASTVDRDLRVAKAWLRKELA